MPGRSTGTILKRWQWARQAVPLDRPGEDREDQGVVVAYDYGEAARRLGEAILARMGLREFAVVCVGSDRSTGDALGPLVGSRLLEAGLDVVVLGSLEQTVNAINIGAAVAQARSLGLPILAVDACLGRPESVGKISVRRGPLVPGSGVGKAGLPPVGDVVVTGVVNVLGFTEHVNLHSTRLSLVLAMARVIAEGIEYALTVCTDC